jgi:hypothetical protein
VQGTRCRGRRDAPGFITPPTRAPSPNRPERISRSCARARDRDRRLRPSRKTRPARLLPGRPRREGLGLAPPLATEPTPGGAGGVGSCLSPPCAPPRRGRAALGRLLSGRPPNPLFVLDPQTRGERVARAPTPRGEAERAAEARTLGEAAPRNRPARHPRPRGATRPPPARLSLSARGVPMKPLTARETKRGNPGCLKRPANAPPTSHSPRALPSHGWGSLRRA